MSSHTTVIRKVAQNVLEYGAPPTFDRATYIDAINKRAEEIKAPGETTEQAFTRAITADDIGKTLYKASKRAKGGETVAPDKTGEPLQSPGPAHAEMERRARAYMGPNPNLSYHQAYAHVFQARENAELRERVKGEQMDKSRR